MADVVKTDITIVLDRSGSMGAVKTDTIGGFNQFLEDQQKLDGECVLSLMQFDTEYEYVHKAVPVKDVPKLTNETYLPRGMTALNDAIGRTVADTMKRVTDKGTRCLFVIITDGEENSSREITTQGVKDLISAQDKLPNWDFVFIGANQDAFASGSNLGVSNIGKTLSNVASPQGMTMAFTSASNYVARARTAASAAAFKSNLFTAEDKAQQEEEASKTKGSNT